MPLVENEADSFIRISSSNTSSDKKDWDLNDGPKHEYYLHDSKFAIACFAPSILQLRREILRDRWTIVFDSTALRWRKQFFP